MCARNKIKKVLRCDHQLAYFIVFLCSLSMVWVWVVFNHHTRKMGSEDLRLFELNTGAKIPSVGLGTWLAAPGVVYDAISTAVNVSFFLFNFSFHYFIASCFVCIITSCFVFIITIIVNLWFWNYYYYVHAGWLSSYRLCSNLWQWKGGQFCFFLFFQINIYDMMTCVYVYDHHIYVSTKGQIVRDNSSSIPGETILDQTLFTSRPNSGLVGPFPQEPEG